jgi:hypothetical protein
MPLEFDDEKSWRAFTAAKAGWSDAEEPAQAGTLQPPGPITACPQCGARDLRLEGTAAACPHCLWRGEPRRFADEASWKVFAQERKNLRGRGGEAG